MIVSLNTYYFICAIIVLLCLSPALYTRFVKKQGNKRDWSAVLILILLPINWFTPAVFTVESCGTYTKNILLLPSSDYSLGRHNYIENKSTNDLLLEYIAYGNVAEDEVGDNITIKAGDTKEVPEIHINYVFESAPESVKLKGKGTVHTRLSCE